jgi:hypothetical protein
VCGHASFAGLTRPCHVPADASLRELAAEGRSRCERKQLSRHHHAAIQSTSSVIYRAVSRAVSCWTAVADSHTHLSCKQSWASACVCQAQQQPHRPARQHLGAAGHPHLALQVQPAAQGAQCHQPLAAAAQPGVVRQPNYTLGQWHCTCAWSLLGQSAVCSNGSAV